MPGNLMWPLLSVVAVPSVVTPWLRTNAECASGAPVALLASVSPTGRQVPGICTVTLWLQISTGGELETEPQASGSVPGSACALNCGAAAGVNGGRLDETVSVAVAGATNPLGNVEWAAS